MKSTTNKEGKDMETGCVEKDCTIEHNGQKFENGGSFMLPCTDGKWRGLVYADWSDKPETVTNWHGTVKVQARYGRVYRGNMGDKRRHVWFTWQGRNYHGCWCEIDFNQAMRVTEVA
jgi:hypothetical protein